MYDLHTHILPGVDDGPQDTADAVEMAHVAARHGTRVMLATPHRKDVTESWSVPYVRDLLEDMNGRIQDEGIVLTLALGMENHLDLDLFEEFSNGRALPINGSRYILVEAPLFGRPNYMEDVLFHLQLQGLTPVLAHPDRSEAFQSDPELLVGFVERGMLSQITAGSIVGHFGRRAQRFANTLLKRGLAHVIASDTHFPSGPRSPELPPGVNAAASVVGRERAQAMVVDTPRAIIENRSVEIEPPARVGRSGRRWWQPWRRD